MWKSLSTQSIISQVKLKSEATGDYWTADLPSVHPALRATLGQCFTSSVPSAIRNISDWSKKYDPNCQISQWHGFVPENSWKPQEELAAPTHKSIYAMR